MASCLSCEKDIERAHFVVGSGLGKATLLQQYCAACGFLEGFRQARLCARPFRPPLKRPTQDGQAPMEELLRFEEWKATCGKEPV